MPVTKSAIKKLRHDRSKTAHNDLVRANLHDTLRKVRKKDISLSEAYAVVDKSAKLNLIHQNKAARLKSKIASVLPQPVKKRVVVKKAVKSSSSKTKKVSTS